LDSDGRTNAGCCRVLDVERTDLPGDRANADVAVANVNANDRESFMVVVAAVVLRGISNQLLMDVTQKIFELKIIFSYLPTCGIFLGASLSASVGQV